MQLDKVEVRESPHMWWPGELQSWGLSSEEIGVQRPFRNAHWTVTSVSPQNTLSVLC